MFSFKSLLRLCATTVSNSWSCLSYHKKRSDQEISWLLFFPFEKRKINVRLYYIFPILELAQFLDILVNLKIIKQGSMSYDLKREDQNWKKNSREEEQHWKVRGGAASRMIQMKRKRSFATKKAIEIKRKET
jgi:hypothetical protein